jgi:L-2-hydroxyglutarate oxidase LhgO
VHNRAVAADRGGKVTGVDRIEVVVIGAGVIGLAIGRALALAGREVLLLERERHFGTGTSSRNSEVIHAGLFYATGSLKARLCVEGRRQLYAYCAEHGVAHRRLGKLVVATRESQREALAAIHASALASGVENCELIDARAARRLEPELACVAALHSQETGIVDSHGLMLALLGDCEAAGGTLACATQFERAARGGAGWVVHTGGEAPFALAADWIVNAAGLHAQEVAARIDALPASHIPRRHLARGCYFQLAGRAPFTRLIYPVPAPGGLGVHLTLDLGDQARFGPDVEWVDAIDYTVDPRRADAFYAEVREYWPRLADDSLAPAYAGIRPKLSGPGEPAADFMIAGPATHGAPGLVNLFGIESPGLTACLAIGGEVERMLRESSS